MLSIIFIAICIIILVLCVGLMVVMVGAMIYPATLRYEEIPNVLVKVVDKQYKEPYSTTTMMYVGKTLIPQTYYYDEEYNVYALYDGERYCIDDEELYESVKIDDEIYVCVHKGYNKDNEEKYIYLTAD